MNICWQHYPRSQPPSDLSRKIIDVFNKHATKIDSALHKLSSDQVLAVLADDLRLLDFKIERGKKKDDKIAIPVLFGLNGHVQKAFHADGYHENERYMIEVEAGRGVTNHQFLKDLFQACACDNVDSLAIGLRNTYCDSKDFDVACNFLDTVFSSRRLVLPLKEVVLIGY